MQGDDKVRRQDYLSHPITGGTATYDRSYLGTQPSHIRDQSLDAAGEEGYDEHAMHRSNSHTPLHSPQPHVYNDPYTSPQSASATPPPGGHVHYPPQTFTSVPLRDESADRASPSPYASGANTPTGSASKKKHWSFLPMHSQTSLENGGQMSEKSGKRPRAARGSSWDLLGERAEWEDFNPKNANVDTLRFAEGDVGTTKASRLYYWLLNRGIVVRWAMYIIPILALLWIPGILGVTATRNAKVWDVKLIWWSIWLTVLWVGFWAATAAFMILPTLWRNIVGSLVPSAKAYTDVVGKLGRYAKLVVWTLVIWVSFTPVVINHYSGAATDSAGATPRSRTDLSTMVNILFGIFLCSIVLGIEKLIIQLIAFQFHRDSYEDRLQEQKFNVRCLTALYINSHDIPGRTDTLRDDASSKTRPSQIPKRALRKALRGLREAAQTTTTALGNVASEMAGQSVLQTNSPSNKVTAALTSANKSKALARRLFYSFRQPGAAHLVLEDIAKFFPNLETAEAAFAVFDIDGNGDASRDEIEAAILIMHRERLSLEASMRDLDGAVRRLDDIFMVIVALIVILILAAMVTTKLTTLVTSAGTFVLGLSWLIGSTMQEILLACIFLFVKHPYDVGDRVVIDTQEYTVAKMQLLSSNFKRWDGKFVWIGHNILATKVIENIRRSGPTAETFTFEVAFDTGFEALQALRTKMIKFCKENHRDFLPIFDVVVDDIPGQGKMVLKADIKYKSNWQQGALKVMRRNKWVCALKMALADLKIYGPAGAGNPDPDPAEPTKYTLVPWEEVNAAATAAAQSKPESPPPTFATATATAALLTDRREVVNDTSQDIWNEDYDLANGSRPGTPGPDSGMMTPASAVSVGPPTGPLRNRVPHGMPGETIEMTSAPVARRP